MLAVHDGGSLAGNESSSVPSTRRVTSSLRCGPSRRSLAARSVSADASNALCARVFPIGKSTLAITFQPLSDKKQRQGSIPAISRVFPWNMTTRREQRISLWKEAFTMKSRRIPVPAVSSAFARSYGGVALALARVRAW